MWTDERIAEEIDDACVRDGEDILYVNAPRIMRAMRDGAFLLVAELEAYIEDRERTTRSQSDDLATYERIVSEYDATLAAQHDRIADLESENARYRIAIDAAQHISQRGLEAQRRIVDLEEFINFLPCKKLIRQARIVELEATVSAYQISENQRLDAIPEATGQDYAEGCAP